MKSAVILAAGIGSRLSPITNNTPKCCIRVKNKSMIVRITDQLLSCNEKMIINIVVGHLSDKVRDEMADYPNNVKIVENLEYQKTNNMESCRIGLEENDVMSGDLLIINGDCVYSDRIVTLMHGLKFSAIGIDTSRFSEENMKILTRSGRAVAISKDILESQGGLTSIDLYNFTNKDVIDLYSIMEGYFHRQDRNKWTEVAINDLLKKAESNVKIFDISGERWMEIDNHDDLEAAQNLW